MTTKQHQYSVATHDLLNAVAHFLTGPAHAEQDSVLKEREPLLWEVAMALYDNDDMAVRLLGRKQAGFRSHYGRTPSTM